MVAEDGEEGALPSLELEEFVDDKKHMWSLIGFSFPKSDYVTHVKRILSIMGHPRTLHCVR